MNKELRKEKRAAKRSRINMFFYEIGRVINQAIFGKRKSRHGIKTKTRQNIFVWTMLAIPILQFLVFWVYVNLNSILLAFQNIDYANGGKVYWTLENFKTIYELFTAEGAASDFMLFGRNTLIFWSVSTFWALPHSILLTYLMHKKIVGYKFFRVVLYLPSLISGVVIAGIFQSFISQNGVLGYVLKNYFGWTRIPTWFAEEEYALGMLVFHAIFFGFAANYVLMSGAMAKIPKEVTEAAMLDGIGMWQELWYIDIPMMWDTISMLIVSSFAGIFGASGAILLFTPSLTSTWTWGYWIFDQVRIYNAFYVPSALGLVFTIVALPIVRLVRRVVLSIYQYDS